LFGRLAQELSLPGVTADLVDDVDRRTLLSCCREQVRYWRPRLQCSFPPMTPQDWSRWGVLVLDHLLDNAMCHALKLVHQAFRVPMERVSDHVVHLLA